jgi:hypothetical protein
MEEINKLESIFSEISEEYWKAREVYGAFSSSHELYAVLLEEVDEFWDSVKSNNPDPKELMQVAATAIAGIIWLSHNKDKK